MPPEVSFHVAGAAVQMRDQVARGPAAQAVQGDVRDPVPGKLELDQVQVVGPLRIGASGHAGGYCQRIFPKEEPAEVKYVRAEVLASTLHVLAAPPSLGLGRSEERL